jgi:Rrf2 family protein
MKLSTRGRYGVRLMLELALHYGEGPILLKEIAERQGISEKYLWQLINPLKTTGLAPEIITVKEILQILEGSLCLVDCVDNPSLCERAPSCISRDIWGEASRSMQLTLQNTTLAAMVERQKHKAEVNREARQ